MKRVHCMLAMLLTLCLIFPAAATADTGSIVSLGADLSAEQREQMLTILTPQGGEAARIVTVTNQEERDLLGSFIPAEQIGTRSLSCSSVTLQEAGTGITVETHNITWVTPQMYKSVLITAGIGDAQVKVSAPFPVSGTAALAGIYKAYEAAVGSTLNEAAKLLAGEELALTGQLGDILGQEEAAALLAELKEEVVRQGLNTPETIRPAIQEGAKQLNISLTDGQIDMLTGLLLKIIEMDLDPQQLAEQVSSIAKTLQNIQKAQEATNSFLDKVQSGWSSVVSWFKGLFGG